MQITTARKISGFVCAIRPEDIPDPVLDQAAWCILDLMGAAMAGAGQPSARSAREFARDFFPAGSAGVWFASE